MAKIGNSQRDRHNARAKEFAKNEKRFQSVDAAYIADKGYTPSSMEAVRRAAKANRMRPNVKVGNYREPED